MTPPASLAKPTDILWTFAAILLLFLALFVAFDIPTKDRWEPFAIAGVVAFLAHARTIRWLVMG